MVGIIKDEVEARLRIKHSPDQISKSLVLRDLYVSHEAIYQHIANDRKANPFPFHRRPFSVFSAQGKKANS
jgi:IS30 family transposase